MSPSELFEQILEKPGMYVSGRSIIQAAAYIRGYVAAQWGLGAYEEGDIFYNFQPWVEKRFKINSTQGWPQIITFFSTDEADAFDLAKKLWQEYKSDPSAMTPGVIYACPCCHSLTLDAPGDNEICPVCYWEDDGQGDADADVVRGGPNGELSLTQARLNYQAFGACEERFKQDVRTPLPEEIPNTSGARMFALILKGEGRFEKGHCCERMTKQVNSVWPLAASPLLGSTDQRIYWSSVFDEYGLICQPSAEILKIQFCPFCGAELPESKRDAWFAQLEKTGWKTWGDSIPKGMLSHDWDKY